jgi:hypothetical protein
MIAAAWATPDVLARWSLPRVVHGATPPYVAVSLASAFSTDEHGDSALAWRVLRQAGRASNWWYDSSVRVAFAGPKGAVTAHTVWRRAHSVIASTTTALDARGELTIAWVEAPSSGKGAITIRSMRRAPRGGWSAAEVVGHSSSAFVYAWPQLAAAPDGEVLLTWYAGSRIGVEAAWRRPGSGFTGVAVVNRSKEADVLFPTPIFDPSGRARIYGTVDCDHPSSRGVLLTAPAHSHHFAPPAVVAPAPATDLTISFGHHGRALAAWQRGECSTLEQAPGEAYGRTLQGGSLGPPTALDPNALAFAITPVAADVGGGTVGWVGEAPTPGAAPTLELTSAGADGRFSPAAPPGNSLIPVGRDDAGDVVLQDLLLEQKMVEGGATPVAGGPSSPIAAQALGAVVPEPSPLSPFAGSPLTRSLSGTITVLAASGRGAAVVWANEATSQVALATWRP